MKYKKLSLRLIPSLDFEAVRLSLEVLWRKVMVFKQNRLIYLKVKGKISFLTIASSKRKEGVKKQNTQTKQNSYSESTSLIIQNMLRYTVIHGRTTQQPQKQQ